MTIATTTGHIRQFDSAHFTNQPGIVMTIECVSGELVSERAITIPYDTINVPQPIITYGEGTAPTGLDLEFGITAPHSNFTISNHAQIWHAGTGSVENEFKVTFNFLAGDVIKMSTHNDNRRISMVRGGVTYDLAGYLNAGHVWPRLYSGVNVFDWDFDEEWMSWTKISYVPRYWGV